LPASASVDLVSRAKRALRERFVGSMDDKGYVAAPEENLLPGVDFGAVCADLRRGDGDELAGKFRAIHSSSGLTVNSFGPFKAKPDDLLLLGTARAKTVEFERPFPIFRGGTPPNLDVWISRVSGYVAIESKCLEYLRPKRAKFSAAYERLSARAEACWWDLYQDSRIGPAQHLDCAQLLKHYFGLCAFHEKNPDVNITLLYLFWEPLNWRDIDVCIRHREQLEKFANAVSDATLIFRWQTYSELWDAWSRVPALEDHAQRLKARYQVEI
jgi:hypothetical protein